MAPSAVLDPALSGIDASRSSWASLALDPAFEVWRGRVPFVWSRGVRLGLGDAGDCAGFLDASRGALFGSAEPGAHRRTLAIGSEPWWTVAGWHERIEGHPSLRRQLGRASRKGVTVGELDIAAPESRALVLAAATWRPETLGFVLRLAPEILFAPRRLFVASVAGAPVGMLLLSPIPGRRAWLSDRFARSPGAPNGTMALLFDGAVRAVEAGGAEGFTMGLSPFEGEVGLASVASVATRAFAGWRFGEALDFAGLRSFKAKFDPERWEPRYLVRSRGLSWWSVGRALDAAFRSP